MSVVLVFYLAALLFWAVFEQGGSTLALFGDQLTRTELFGWSFQKDETDTTMDYRITTAAGADRPSGGILNTGGKFPSYATFYVVVEDVAARVAKAERLGAKALLPPTTAPNGLVFAQLHDPAGNQIGIFTPAPTS